jgi:hypothetical protein
VVLTTPPRKKFLVTKPHIKTKICEAAKVLQELQSHGGGGRRNKDSNCAYDYKTTFFLKEITRGV